jgi:hypothetical protein
VRPGAAAGLLAVATSVIVVTAAVAVRSRHVPSSLVNVACSEGSLWKEVSARREGASYALARNGEWVATVPLNACSLLKKEHNGRLGR